MCLSLPFSREEWEWLQKMVSVEEPAPAEPGAETTQNHLFQELQVAIKELMTLVNIPLQEVERLLEEVGEIGKCAFYARSQERWLCAETAISPGFRRSLRTPLWISTCWRAHQVMFAALLQCLLAGQRFPSVQPRSAGLWGPGFLPAAAASVR